MATESLKALQQLGFTEAEARVYLILLAGPPATGYRIAMRAGMSRSMVYEALGRLEGRGAVLRSGDGRGILYRPVRSDDLLDRMQRDYRDQVDRLRRDLHRPAMPDPAAGFWTGRGHETIDAVARRLLTHARRELLLVMPDEAIERFEPDLVAACRRRVRVGVVTTGKHQAPCGLSVRHPSQESEVQRIDQVLLICADAEEVMIADLKGEGSATLTAEALMVHIARQFVWMELLTQCLHRSGADPLALLPQDDRSFLEAVALPVGPSPRRRRGPTSRGKIPRPPSSTPRTGSPRG